MMMKNYLELVSDETNRRLLKQLIENRAACAKIIEDTFSALGLKLDPSLLEQFEIIGELDCQIRKFKNI